MPTPTTTKRADASDLWFMTAYAKVLLSRAANADGISLLEHRMAVGFGPPLHIHHNEEETFIIMDGEFRFSLGGSVRLAKAGDTVYLPKGIPHGFRVISPSGGRCVTITRGRFEDMVRAASRPAPGVVLPEQTPPTPEQQAHLAALCSENGIDLIGPPIE